MFHTQQAKKFKVWQECQEWGETQTYILCKYKLAQTLKNVWPCLVKLDTRAPSLPPALFTGARLKCCHQMCGFSPPTRWFCSSLIPAGHATIQLGSDPSYPELAQIPQREGSVLQDFPHPLQGPVARSKCHLYFWPTVCKSGLPWPPPQIQ